MKRSLLRISLFVSLIAMPVSAFAAANTLEALVIQILSIANGIVPLLFLAALIAFMWGIIRYIYSADPKQITEARSYIFYSLLSITVMLSVWGLALFVKNSFFPASKVPLTCLPEAQQSASIFLKLINQLIILGNYTLPIFIGIAVIAFIWGVIRYVISADPKKVQEARNFIIFSIVGISLIMGIWGVARILKRTFFPNTGSITDCIVTPPSSGLPTDEGGRIYDPEHPEWN